MLCRLLSLPKLFVWHKIGSCIFTYLYSFWLPSQEWLHCFTVMNQAGNGSPKKPLSFDAFSDPAQAVARIQRHLDGHDTWRFEAGTPPSLDWGKFSLFPSLHKREISPGTKNRSLHHSQLHLSLTKPKCGFVWRHSDYSAPNTADHHVPQWKDIYIYIITLWLFSIAMENPLSLSPSPSDFPL